MSSTGHAFQSGSTSSLNIIIDGNEVLARNNGGSSQLNLNTNGGVVRIGDQAAGTMLSVRGPILAEDSATITGDVIFDSSGAIFFDKSDQSLKFGDNYRAFFGASTDLQIYHDGNNSVIRDAGQGDLFVRGSTVRLDDPTSKDYLVGNEGSSVELYFNLSLIHI